MPLINCRHILILIVSSCLLFLSCSVEETVVLSFGGDVMFDRGVSKRIDRYGIHSLFTGIKEYLCKADISLINLECPLTVVDAPAEKEHIFKGKPVFAETICDAGITHVNLANNHTFDHGSQGLLETLSALESHGVEPIGIKRGDSAPCTPKIVIKNGFRIAFFASNLVVAEASPKERTLLCTICDSSLVSTIEGFHADNPDVYVVVSLHWGFEFMEFPTSAQTKLAKELINAGADIIVGHHPHVIQPIEFYKNGLILYSLGNLVFDQQSPWTSRSMIVSVKLSHNGIASIDIYPLKILNCCPMPCSKVEWGKLDVSANSLPIGWHFVRSSD